MEERTIGFGLCGSFCTFASVLPAMEAIKRQYAAVVPIFSGAASTIDSRFGTAESFIRRAEEICGTKAVTTIAQAEPVGPKKLLDVLVIAPCTGNTLAKLAAGVADTPVTLACKAHLRNGRPVVLAVSTNDGLAANAKNIGELLNRKHFYFVPFGQDSPMKKPCSLVAHLELLPQTVAQALAGKQIQPLLCGPATA